MWLWRVAIVVGWGSMAASAFLFGWEVLLWLRDGTWQSISLSRATHIRISDGIVAEDWQRLEYLFGIAHWLGQMPAAMVLFVGGIVCSWRANDLYMIAETKAGRP